MKILVGIPSYQLPCQTNIEFTNQLDAKDILYKRDQPISKCRNNIVQEFLNRKDYTHLLMIDSDCAITLKDLDKLYRRRVPIVAAPCGIYKDGRLMWNLFDERDNKFFPIVNKQLPLDMKTVDIAGTGCMLFTREVFHKVPKPWFEFPADSDMGEDFYFCKKARQRGYKIHVEPTIQCSHAKSVNITSLLSTFGES